MSTPSRVSKIRFRLVRTQCAASKTRTVGHPSGLLLWYATWRSDRPAKPHTTQHNNTSIISTSIRYSKARMQIKHADNARAARERFERWHIWHVATYDEFSSVQEQRILIIADAELAIWVGVRVRFVVCRGALCYRVVQRRGHRHERRLAFLLAFFRKPQINLYKVTTSGHKNSVRQCALDRRVQRREGALSNVRDTPPAFPRDGEGGGSTAPSVASIFRSVHASFVQGCLHLRLCQRTTVVRHLRCHPR